MCIAARLNYRNLLSVSIFDRQDKCLNERNASFNGTDVHAS
jgi:hypothetical protein